MNAELKAMLLTVFALIQIVKDLVNKKPLEQIFLDLEKLAPNIPAVIANWPDLMPEIKALQGADADADIMTFIVSQVPGVTDDAKVQRIIAAVLDFAFAVGQKGAVLIAAIES